MSDEEYYNIIVEIESLPSGGITYKTINGIEYAYYQWREGGKQRARRVREEEYEELSRLIDRRKELQTQAKDYVVMVKKHREDIYQFRSSVIIGEKLIRFAKPVEKWAKRECFVKLHDYIYGDINDKVFILYGIRRTGKTTLIRQIINEMTEEMRSHSVFIQARDGMDLGDINMDLKYLESKGYRYVFIDEVTLLEDFIEGAELLSDVFAASGMKIVLSGTDSLGFILSEDESLYDRCIMAHTTFIPYREFENVLGIKGIDNYIQYGGTMSLGGKDYNETIFANNTSTNEYVDSAISKNIQHSLRNYQHESHLRSLRDLYEKDELTNAINRIVEDMNHRFTVEVLTRNFQSADLKISAGNLKRDRENPTDILQKIDVDILNEKLKNLLEIKDKSQQTVSVTDSHRIEIKEYLNLLDLIVEIESRWMDDYNHKEYRTVFSQPGLRYCQAEALINSLIQDDLFRELSFGEKRRVTERILSEIKGRMMEDIILLETTNARKNAEVFKLLFPVGEFDMVVFNPKEGYCELYEIKHSTQVVPQQCNHLLDSKKCDEAEFRFGPVKKKSVIYRGETTSLQEAGFDSPEDIQYINVEEYLKEL